MLTIRRFQKGDEEILSIMIRRTLREVNYTSPKSELDYLIPHYSPETMVELSETAHTYVLEEDGQIIGSGTVLPDGETEAEIVAAFLSPESIGKGYGRKLFATLEADELAAKATRVWLTSSDMAVEFYEHMGWVNPNGPRARAGEDNLLYMKKRKKTQRTGFPLRFFLDKPAGKQYVKANGEPSLTLKGENANGLFLLR